MTPDKDRAESAQPVVASLAVAASTREPAPPSRARIERLAERTRRDPVWRHD